jgi:hypothetical protein
MDLTQELLKKYVHYDPDTGLFKNILYRKGGVPVGHVYTSKEATGYVVFRINMQTYKAHRLAFLYMTGAVPKCVDHINTIRDDNRWCNLRPADRSQNVMNASLREDNKSGVKGVSWHKRDKVWQARVAAYGKEYHLGYFDDKQQAEATVASFRQSLHGEYSRQNNFKEQNT